MTKVFGGIYFTLSDDLLQLPPAQQQEIFIEYKKEIRVCYWKIFSIRTK